MAEHSTLTGSSLHEPKGASSAVLNTVYVSDGAGSGAWELPPNPVANNVIVTSPSDFPTAVAGVITLIANTNYEIVGSINLGTDRIAISANNQLYGLNQLVDEIVYSGTEALFTSSVSFLLTHVGWSAPNGSIFNLSGASTESLVITDCLTTAAGCVETGDITSWRSLTINDSSLSNATGRGLKFFGACTELTINHTEFHDVVGAGLDLGTATFDRISLGPNCHWEVEVGNIGLAGASGGANLNVGGFASVENSIFDGAGTHVSVITQEDNGWEFTNNYGIPDTRRDGQGNIEGNALTTTWAGIGSANAVVVNFGTGFVPDVEEHFTISTAGRYTYSGSHEHLFLFHTTLFASIGGGASRQYVYSFYKNGVELASSRAKAEYDGSNPGSNSVSTVVNLADGDYVELYVYAVSVTTALTVDTAATAVIGV
jgi:hypothetical protein